MIKHIVVFQFEGLDAAKEAEMTAAFHAMFDQIPELRSLSFGPNLSPRDKTFTHALVEEFDDMDALARYVAHPVHDKLVQDFVAPYAKTRHIVDYEL